MCFLVLAVYFIFKKVNSLSECPNSNSQPQNSHLQSFFQFFLVLLLFKILQKIAFMKKLLILFVTVFGISFCDAQTVNIPDANFKTALLNYQPSIDTNNDGQIQVSEALNVTELEINNTSIVSMTGIEAFVNLTNLDCFGLYNLSSLNVSNLTNLQNLDCSFCLQLTSLNLSNNNALINFTCANSSQLNSLNVNGLTNLQTLDCSGCSLTTLDVSNLTSLNNLGCSNNSLTSLITTGANNITFLVCNSNILTSLSVANMTNLSYLNCSHQFNSISGMGGITNLDLTGLSNLTHLECSSNHLNSLDVSALSNLTYLNFGSNLITSIDLSNLTQLHYLSCSYNDLSVLDITMLTNLEDFNCSGNELNTLNIDPLIHLTNLNCSDNNLSSLNFSNNINLEVLNCSSNQLTTINLDNLGYLTNLNLAYNLLTTIDVSNTGFNLDQNPTIVNYDFGHNPNLVSVNVKNGLYEGVNGFHIDNCTSLLHVCADDINIPTITNSLQYSGITTAQVNSYCSFVPGGVHNTISGTITMDINNNGCDATDYHPTNLKVTINDGFNSGATFSNNGNYSFYTQTGSFVLTPQFQNPYFTVTPVTATLNFPNLNGTTQTQNFCITPNGIHNDVDVTLLPIMPAQPGFDATYQLIYKNKGNQVLSGTVTLNFDDAVLDLVSAFPNVNSQTTNVLSWNYSNLLPFESRSITLVLNVNAPTEIPPVNINDELVFTSTINPISGDETASDNVFNLNQIVVGSYDPNDKTCLEGTTISPTKIGDYLHYLIRFQNSGTAPATNIVVKDMIDATKFDINTLQLITTSHPQVTRITGNKVEFIFQGINLPAEQDNEPASHGFIAFKIKTKNNLLLGNSVSNTADIYFDYNFPIITNTATSTFTALGANEFENKSVNLFPNPTKNILTITAKENITFIQLFDIQGRLIETKLTTSTEAKFDISKQLAGIYFVKVYTENGVKIEKIIKQ